MKSQSHLLVQAVICCLFSMNSARAQSDMKKLFSDHEVHSSYHPKDKFIGTDYYWIEGDTLFHCRASSGQKIALADIDFSKTVIQLNEFLFKEKNTPVYVLQIYPLDNKRVSGFYCDPKGYPVSSILPDPKPTHIYLDMETKHIAQQARDYLKQLAGSPGNTDERKKNNFESQFYELLKGMKDDFESLKGNKIDATTFASKVQLDGSISTSVNNNDDGEKWLSAFYGTFSNRADAKRVYDKIVKQIDDIQKSFISITKLPEQISDPLTVQAYMPIDIDGDNGKTLSDFTIKVQLAENIKFDKNLNKTSTYLVTFVIDKD